MSSGRNLQAGRRPRVVALIALLAAVTSDCSTDGTGTRPVPDSVWGHATLVEEASIGAADGSPEVLFGIIRGVAASYENIFVLDLQVGVIRVYDLQGQYLHDIGRPGDGPGELRRPFDLSLSKDGRLYVRDAGKGLVFEVAADGAFVGERMARGGMMVAAEDGVIWLRQLDRERSEIPNKLVFARVAFGPDGETGERISEPETETEPAWLRLDSVRLEPLQRSNQNAPLSREVPFAHARIVVMAPGGELIHGTSTRYRFTVERLDGSRTEIDRPYEPVLVSSDEAAWHRRRLTLFWREAAPDWRWDGPDIPSHKAPYRNLLADQSGRVWVIREAAGVPLSDCDHSPESYTQLVSAPCWAQPYFADVYETGGRFLGTVDLPEGLRFVPPPFIRDDMLVAVFEDFDGTYLVKRYRLQTES